MRQTYEQTFLKSIVGSSNVNFRRRFRSPSFYLHVFCCATLTIFGGCITSTVAPTEIMNPAIEYSGEVTRGHLEGEVGPIPVAIVRSDLNGANADDVAKQNVRNTHYYRTSESQYYREKSDTKSVTTSHAEPEANVHDWPVGLPKLSLSLSGGGLRSAAYSIGVMRGLNDIGFFEELDLISSVSGGAYASSYLLVQALERDDATIDSLLGPRIHALSTDPETTNNPCFTANLESEAVVNEPLCGVAAEKTGFVTKINALVSFFGGIVMWPFDRVAALSLRFLPYEANTGYRSFASYGYSGEIGKKFHDVGRFQFQQKRFSDWSSKAVQLRDRGYPMVLFNGTATSGRVPACWPSELPPHQQLSKAVFEIGPGRVGNDYLGYTTTINGPIAANISTQVAASGSALDLPTSRWCPLQAFLALRTGIGYRRFQGVPGNASQRVERQNMTIDETLNSKNVFITDGGHSENLGALAPIRRLSKKIVIVDAEHDPRMIFEAYGRLKNYLKQSLGVNLNLAELEQLAKKNRRLLLSSTPIVERHAPQELECKSEGGAEWCWDMAKITKLHKKAIKNDDAGKYFQAASLPLDKVVFTGGTIGPFPYNGSTEPLYLEIVYVKLGFDRKKREQDWLSDTPWQYYEKFSANSAQGCRQGFLSTEQCPFPQEPTTDQSYTEEQFRAYMDLGRITVHANAAKFREEEQSD